MFSLFEPFYCGILYKKNMFTAENLSRFSTFISYVGEDGKDKHGLKWEELLGPFGTVY